MTPQQQLEILQSWAVQGFASNLVEKALSSASTSGQALSPQSLEKEMTNTIQRLSPEMSMYRNFGAIVKISSKIHEFNKLITMPQSGSSQGESTTTPITASAYEKDNITLKIFRRKGAVTDFLQDVSREYADAMQLEVDNQLLVQIWDMITETYFGNAAANSYGMDGLESIIGDADNTASPGNRISYTNKGGTPFSSLRLLDQMIDYSNRKGGAKQPRAFLCSPEMVSAITSYETTIRKVVEVGRDNSGKFGQIVIPGGHRLETYRGIPLIQTTHLSPVETMSPTITLAGEDTTVGSLSNGTYYVRIAPVTNQGEQLASAEQSVTLSGGTATQRVKITLNKAHAGALYYKIYMSQTTGTEKLVKQVSALFYSDSVGTLDLTQFNGQSGTDIYVKQTAADTEISIYQKADVPLDASNGVNPEYLILQSFDPIQGLGKIVYANIMTGGSFGGLITTEPLAKTDAFRQFLMYSHAVLVPTYDSTSFLVRNIRTQ